MIMRHDRRLDLDQGREGLTQVTFYAGVRIEPELLLFMCPDQVQGLGISVFAPGPEAQQTNQFFARNEVTEQLLYRPGSEKLLRYARNYRLPGSRLRCN